MESITSHLSRCYSPEDYPALSAQLREWRETRPLSGISVLDATPVFTNTLAKYLPLLAAGAALTVGVGGITPCDPRVLKLLYGWGVPIAAPADGGTFDVVMDCAGVFSTTPSRYGYVELTKSGLYYYREHKSPVFFADAGRIKLIETSLGTGEGFLRAMKSQGFSFSGKKVLVFGGGKVGCGIAMYAARGGADTVVADISGANVKYLPPGARLMDCLDTGRLEAAIQAADCIVSATGIAGALASHAAQFRQCRAVIVNMGVEDEFGPELPESRVLNGKRPLNFALEEPTRLRYIDPTMALDNAGALELLQRRVKSGISVPAPELEECILSAVRSHGLISDELKMIGEW